MTALFNYHPETGEFLTETQARRDPLDGTPLVPGNATLTAPPAKQAGMAQVFRDGAWVQIEDHRGETYWLPDGSAHDVTDLGALPDEALDAEPALPLYADLVSARSAMVAWIDEFLTKITGQVPSYERESWPTKAEAARAFIAGTARPDQASMIDGEAQTSGRTSAEVAAVIVARAETYQDVIGRAAGLRVALDEALEAEPDPMNYEAILEGGKVQAGELAAALGIVVN